MKPEETIMNTDINIADIVVHLHPRSCCEDRTKIERDLRAQNGVISVHFNAEDHPHALVVAYNPRVISAQALLSEIRKCDREAVMASL